MNRWGIGVRVDGVDIGDVVIEGGQIEYGRSDVLEQPMPTTCDLTLFTQDGYPQNPNSWFEYGVGDWTTAASGFEADHDTEATYVGPRASIYIGAPVWVSATTDPGFSAGHDTEDTYLGAEFRRFTGKVQAIEYDLDRLRVFCVTDMEQWARAGIKELAPGTLRSAYETDRAEELCDLAPSPTTLHVQGGTEMTFADMLPEDFPVCLLDELQRIAAESDGIIYANRQGNVTFQTRDYDPGDAVDIPPGVVDKESLGMNLELGSMLNRVTVEYGHEPSAASLSTIDGTWVMEAGSGTPASGKLRYSPSGTPAVDDTVTVYLHHTDTDGNAWTFTSVKPRQRVTLTAAEVWTGKVESSTVHGGPTGYTEVTIRILTVTGAIVATDSVRVTFEPPVQGDRPSATVTDSTLLALYGTRAALFTTTLATESDAEAHANTVLWASAPGWQMPDLEVQMNLATDAQVETLAAVDLGHVLTVDSLPAGAPVPSFTGKVLGYSEYLSSDDWEIEFHLAPVTAIDHPSGGGS